MHRLLETRHESVTVAQAVDSSDPDAAMQVHSQVVTLVDRNEYDQAGRRLTQIVGSYAGNAGEMTRYKFDLADRVIETIQPGGGEFRTRAVYDKQGRKIAEVDQNGNASTWNYDYFGLLMSRTDLSDNEYRFSYDHARQLTTTINERYSDSAAQLINTYNTAGQLTKIKDVALNQTTEYWYDLSGQHVREKTTQNGTAYQDNLMAYDELGRLRHVSDGRMSIDIAYDAVGNRVNLRTHTNVPTMADPTVDVPKDSDLWFTYDSMNRQTGADLQRFRDIDGNWAYGFYTKLNGIEIIPGVSGHRITYDLNGNRASDTYLGTKVRLVGGTAPTYYEEDGQLYELTPGTDPRYEVQPMPMSWEVVETYSYDGLGRLTGALRDGVAIDQRLYDQAGRVVVQGPQNLPKSYAEAINKNVAPGDAYGQEYRINRYDSNGRLMRQQSLDSEQRAITSDTQYTTYDKAGNVVSYKVTVPGQYTNTYTFTRERFDGYKEKSNRATSTRFESGQTDSHYDVNGNLIRIDDQKKNENDRNFVNDLTGHALFVQQGDAVQRQVVVNGEVLGRYGVGLNEKTPRDKDGNPIFTELADFSSYQPITGSYPSASVGSYQVRNGDTLRSIARQSYGDEGLWYRIAETNGLSGDRDLRVGQTITIPSAVGSIRNNAGTFQPYDPSKITGDTSPYMPTPHAGGGGCGGIGMLLVIVVAAVVTVFTAGAAALAMAGTLSATTSVGAIATAGAAAMTSGTLAGAAAAAIGAAVGSIVSQGVAMAVGLQDKFSWKQVGMSAIGGAVSAALPPGAFPTIGGSPAATLAVRGAVNNAITQGIGVATGLQDSFNWRGVAAAGASAFVTGKLAGSVMGSQEGTGLVGALGGDEAAVVAGRTVLGIAGGLTSALVRGGKISIGKIAVDAFGNALGDGVVESMRAEPQGRGPWSEFGYQNGSDIQSEQAPGLRRQAQEQAALVETFKSAAASFNPDDYAKGPLVAGPGGATRVDELSRNVRELTALSKAVVASTPATAQMAPGSYDGPGGRLELSSIPGGRSDSIDAAITARLNRESVIRETVVRNDPTLIEAERIAADEPPRIEPVDSGISAAEMASRFGQGVVGAAKAVTIEPVLQVRDMGLALLSVGYNEIWRSGDEPRWYPEMKSGVAEAYEHGVSQAKLVLQSNPITGVGVLTHDLTTAGMNRDWGSVAELSGGVAGGFVIGKATANYGGYGVRWAPGDIGRSPLPSQRGASSLLNFDIVKPNSTPAWVKESPNYVEGLPFTYKAKPFQNFVNRFHEEFAAAGFDDVEGFMQGSSASGIKFRTQQRLDARNGLTPSDYDVAIVSPKLLQAAREQGLNVLNGPLNEKQLGALGLIEAQNSLQAASKGQLPVNFMVYESAQAVLKAQKTIPFSDWRK
ncbi:hypothetical protein CDL60_28545 [Roseateles noduli]|nr:hypothetical protein CDL60_28545 [Roseateles noduli]